MKWTHENLLRARDAVADALGSLDLETYFFAVEPRGDVCEIRVEYASEEGWKSRVLRVEDALLSRSPDGRAHRALTQTLQENLASAKRRVPAATHAPHPP